MQLLEECKNELTNLSQKLAKGEPEGWEGSKYRCVLKSRIENAVQMLSYEVT